MFKPEKVHKDLIKAGDVIVHDGKEVTLSEKDIKTGFMGTTILGDSYRLGTLSVIRLKYIQP